MAKIAFIFVAFVVVCAAKVDANISYEWEYFREMLAHYIEPSQCDDVIAYYKFDRSLRDVCFGNNAVSNLQNPTSLIELSSGISNGAVHFSVLYSTKLRISGLNGYDWSSQFSVSLWFKRSDFSDSYYYSHTLQGLISNEIIEKNLLSNGSWGMTLKTCGRTISGNGQDCIGASIVTSHSVKAWENVTMAISKYWHHLVMTYDGNTINFYLDNHLKLSDSKCCHGDIVTKNTDVIIGYTTKGYKNDGYFNGYIDEVILFKRALSALEVTKLYRLENSLKRDL